MKFTPSKLENLAGNSKQFQDLKDVITAKKPVLIYGPPGIGKTSSVHIIAQELGLKVIEINSSDQRKKDQLDFLLKIVNSKSFIPLLILVDECDGLNSSKDLENLAGGSNHSIVFTANELYKVPDSIKKRCIKIEFKPPQIREVVTFLRVLENKTHQSFNFTNISQDVRSSLSAVLYGGEGYSRQDVFDQINAYFSGQDLPSESGSLIWLLDNCEKFFSGRELYFFIKHIALADRLRHPEFMNNIKRESIGRVNYPYYFRRITALKGENNGKAK